MPLQKDQSAETRAMEHVIQGITLLWHEESKQRVTYHLQEAQQLLEEE